MPKREKSSDNNKMNREETLENIRLSEQDLSLRTKLQSDLESDLTLLGERSSKTYEVHTGRKQEVDDGDEQFRSGEYMRPPTRLVDIMESVPTEDAQEALKDLAKMYEGTLDRKTRKRVAGFLGKTNTEFLSDEFNRGTLEASQLKELYDAYLVPRDVAYKVGKLLGYFKLRIFFDKI